MDTATASAVQKALELLKAGKETQAHGILVAILKEDPEVAEAWYLLGFVAADFDKKYYCFQQVLRIDPFNQAAQKQLARLTKSTPAAPEEGTAHAQPFFTLAPGPAASIFPEPVPGPIASIPEPAPAPINKPLPKAKKSRKFPVWIALAAAAFAVIAICGGGVLYISNGRDLNQQAETLFVQGKCAEVLQYSSFGKSFPRFLFSSFFGVYEQVEECQAHLQLEQAVKAQDWPTAYNVIENYLVAHPNGTFVADMNEQAGDILLSWSKSLILQNDYKAAIEKLESIQRGFPTSSAVPVALTTIFDDYLLWAKHSFEQKDYPSAEQTLKFIYENEQASAEQAQQASEGLAVVYLQWGKMQIESGEYDKAVEYYERARIVNPGLTDYDRLEDQIKLLRVADLVKVADFDGALAILKDLSETSLSEESKADSAAEQSRVLDAYAQSDSPQAQTQMITAATNMCKKQLPTIPIFATQIETIRFAIVAPYTLQLPDDWTAKIPAELHYVVCIEQSQTRIQSCPYTGRRTVYRNRYVWNVALYDLASDKPYKTTKVQGTEPRFCAQRETFYGYATSSDINGGIPRIEQVVDWLTGLKILK